MPLSWKPVRVRPATLEDVPVLLELGDELGRATGRGGAAQRFGEAIADPDRHLVLAVTQPDGGDEEVLGMALFTIGCANPLLDLPAVLISHSVVSHRHRQRGAGKSIVAAAAAFADERGIDQLVISVNPTSREAARFYARLGFAPLSVRRTAPVAVVRRRLGAPRLRV
jgi:ribosomal protein S18 acetylase RimI-like enzyme